MMFAKFYRYKILVTLCVLSMLGCKRMRAKFNEQHNRRETQMLKDACSPPPGMVDSILLEAAKQGKTITIKTMLANGANINTKDKDGLTPLMHAASNAHVEIVEILLKKGADVKQKNRRGETALMLAKSKHNKKIIKLIMEGGAKF